LVPNGKRNSHPPTEEGGKDMGVQSEKTKTRNNLKEFTFRNKLMASARGDIGNLKIRIRIKIGKVQCLMVKDWDKFLRSKVTQVGGPEKHT